MGAEPPGLRFEGRASWRSGGSRPGDGNETIIFLLWLAFPEPSPPPPAFSPLACQGEFKADSFFFYRIASVPPPLSLSIAMSVDDESDWSDSSAGSVASSFSTSVMLGLPDGSIACAADLADACVSRLGGPPAFLQTLPAFPDPATATACPTCARPTELLLQLYAPLEGSVDDRVVYVFGCARAGCQGEAGGSKKGRCVLPARSRLSLASVLYSSMRCLVSKTPFPSGQPASVLFDRPKRPLCVGSRAEGRKEGRQGSSRCYCCRQLEPVHACRRIQPIRSERCCSFFVGTLQPVRSACSGCVGQSLCLDQPLCSCSACCLRHDDRHGRRQPRQADGRPRTGQGAGSGR